MRAGIHVIVGGRVQGVSFRWTARREAVALGLTGWIRNRRDGRVEAWAEGERSGVEVFASWMRRGPTFARVVDVRETWGEATGEFADFAIRPSD